MSTGEKKSIPVAAGPTMRLPTSNCGRPGGEGKNNPCFVAVVA
jgi:hypothetical protein